MLETLFAPISDWGLLVLRLGLGAVFTVHGWAKLNPKGPMGGPAGFIGFLKQLGVPLPAFFGWVVVLLETAGAVLLILGLGTRLLAAGLVIDMIVAITKVKRGMAKAAFIDPKGGWEFDFALLAQALALVFTGAGGLALDPIVGF
ncbi:MAG: DoxX family protein [Anaerolineales bacterium]